MIRSIIIVVYFLIQSLGSFSQTDSIRKEYNARIINSISETNWLFDTTHQHYVTIFRIDSFFVCSNFNPIRGFKKLDTLYIQFSYENDWSQSKIDSIEKLNLEILNKVVPNYINYYDSIGWGRARVKKQQLLEQPKSSILQDWNKLKYISESERSSLFNLVRIPDTLIGNIGIFHSRNFPPMYNINPISLKIEVDLLLEKLNKNVLSIKKILRNEGYFLTEPFEEMVEEK